MQNLFIWLRENEVGSGIGHGALEMLTVNLYLIIQAGIRKQPPTYFPAEGY